MVKRVLERENCVVDTARDGFEAIEMLKANDYDLVFLDMMLPQIDGFGVLHFLRNSDPHTLNNVIIMTAGSTDRIREPVRAVMTKPFELDQLRAVVRESRSVPN
jgi:two-component system response regulator (stage 0 sporulation protein F)